MIRKPFLLLLFLGICVSSFVPAYGQSSQTSGAGEETLFSGAVKPNILILLDNSNSMDEDFFGNGVGFWSPLSKSAAARNVLNPLITTYAQSMRLGLMSYRLPAVSPGYIGNTAYFVSYQPKSFCPDPDPACVDYCRDPGNAAARAACESSCRGPAPGKNPVFDVTDIDDSISGLSVGSAARDKYCRLNYPKTRQLPNPSDPGKWIYYKNALPFYDGTPLVTHFGVATSSTYQSNDDWQDDIYERFFSKTGTSDALPVKGGSGEPGGYSGYLGVNSDTRLRPSDSDIALSYNEFGKRVVFFPVGRSWWVPQGTSPGSGYLHAEVKTNDLNNNHLDALQAKLRAYESDPTGYMSCPSPTDPNICSYILNAGLTPTAGTLQTAISYFQGTYQQGGTASAFPSPIQAEAAACQKSYVIYVTDGLPSVDPNGVTGSADTLIPGVLDKIRALRNLTVNVGGRAYAYDIRTYVVGVGLTSEAKAKLDALAVAGGTDVNGQAFYADNAAQLQDALEVVFTDIQSNTYSFSLPSVPSVRFQDENFLYAASFDPLTADPLWKGQLRKYKIEDNGSLGNVLWEAGAVLEETDQANRRMFTLIGGIPKEFTKEEIAPTYLALADSKTLERDQIVAYVRGNTTLPSGSGGQTVPNPDAPRKLGDIFHSSPVTIGTPSLFFNDPGDKKQAFDKFRRSHPRTSSGGSRIILAGANDGQLHAFETGLGREKWSFIPPSLLPKLADLAHVSHPTGKRHRYFVDGPISAADVWLPATEKDGTEKEENEWRTLAVLGLGMGVRGSGDSTDYLWNKSPFCDGLFKDKYTPGFENYCGYYALDVTDTQNDPAFRWTLKPANRSQAEHLGEPWSKMVMGKVKIDGKEKWVGFVGGGYTAGTPKKGGKGKGFFVVDLKTGGILWSQTAADHSAMDYVPGTPAIVDKDHDGFVDTAYVGDLAGNLWKVSFCPYDPDEAKKARKCNPADWSAMLLYNSGGDSLPIFTTPALAKDLRDYWVFWGTGDKANPNNRGPQNKFFALRDQNPSQPYTRASLEAITSNAFSGGMNGWFLGFSGQERVLSDATVFKGIVFFTTYTPPAGENLCGATGSGALYGIAMMPVSVGGILYQPGQSVFAGPIPLGAGIPSAPVISQKPIDGIGRGGTPDLYVGVSGGSGTQTEIKSGSLDLPQGGRNVVSEALGGAGASTSIIHWRDRRARP